MDTGHNIWAVLQYSVGLAGVNQRLEQVVTYEFKGKVPSLKNKKVFFLSHCLLGPVNSFKVVVGSFVGKKRCVFLCSFEATSARQ